MKYEILYCVDNWPVHAQVVESLEEARKREEEFITSATKIHPLTAKQGKGFNCEISKYNQLNPLLN